MMSCHGAAESVHYSLSKSDLISMYVCMYVCVCICVHIGRHACILHGTTHVVVLIKIVVLLLSIREGHLQIKVIYILGLVIGRFVEVEVSFL